MSCSSNNTIAFVSFECSGRGADAACVTQSGTEVDAWAATAAINIDVTRTAVVRNLIDCSPRVPSCRWAERPLSAQPVPGHRHLFSDRSCAGRGTPKPYKKGWLAE